MKSSLIKITKTALAPRTQAIWIIRGFLIPLLLGCFALSPTARAVTPAPDGGYPNGNTAEGDGALFNLNVDIGTGNTAVGASTLFNDTTGSFNTATGFNALSNNTASNNTANGAFALFTNAAGSSNTANGYKALFTNNGVENTASGVNALLSNTTGNNNTATGVNALEFNNTGSSNTANGVQALQSNTIGSFNTAIGEGALFSNTTGSNNTAVGEEAGLVTTGSNNIDIGNTGKAGESNYIRIGTKETQTHTLIAGISGATVAGGVGVIIDTNGHLGTIVSSERYKDAIKPMDKASEAILALKPVTFRYKHELDPDGIPQFGLVAEQVEKVNPALVARDDQGKPYTVRYEAVNAMLLNEFLKAHRKIEEQAHVNQQQEAINSMLESTVARQQKEIKGLTASLKEQASQIQKVSAQLEVTKPAPQMVLNNQ